MVILQAGRRRKYNVKCGAAPGLFSVNARIWLETANTFIVVMHRLLELPTPILWIQQSQSPAICEWVACRIWLRGENLIRKFLGPCNARHVRIWVNGKQAFLLS